MRHAIALAPLLNVYGLGLINLRPAYFYNDTPLNGSWVAYLYNENPLYVSWVAYLYNDNPPLCVLGCVFV